MLTKENKLLLYSVMIQLTLVAVILAAFFQSKRGSSELIEWFFFFVLLALTAIASSSILMAMATKNKAAAFLNAVLSVVIWFVIPFVAFAVT